LEVLKSGLRYLPLTTTDFLQAAGLWAAARKGGMPTADPREIDCDVLLAAQAIASGGIVATENVGHIGRFVEARHWRDIAPD
jgi:predicted nucleic acid-binding protein